MASRHSESAVLNVSVDKVWSLIRPMNFIFSKAVMSTKALGDKWAPDAFDAMHVGDQRVVNYVDGTKQTISLTDLSDSAHRIGWTVVSSEPALSYLGAHHTVTLHRITTDPHSCVIEWESEFSKDADGNVIADAKLKQLDAFRDLRNEAAKTYTFFSTGEEVASGAHLSGKVVLVTGGNSGLGFETVRVLATTGATVVFTARDEKKIDSTIAELKKAAAEAAAAQHAPPAHRLGHSHHKKNPHPTVAFGGVGNVHGIVCALDSIASVRKAIAEFNSKFKSLHLLIANAGVMACEQTKTVDGFEMQFGTNHIGHFVLVNGLLPVLKSSAPSRVVMLSSGLHRRHEFRASDPNWTEAGSYNRWTAYGSSKTANILFAKQLQANLTAGGVKNVTVNAVHPGVIPTPLGRHIGGDVMVKDPIWGKPGDAKTEAKADAKAGSGGSAAATAAAKPAAKTVTRITAPRFKTVAQGVSTTLTAALHAPFGEHGGHYLEDCAIAEPNSWAADMGKAAELWTITEKLIAEVDAKNKK